MTRQELVRWHTFTLRHPLPADLIDTHLAQIASIVCNLARGEGTPPFTPDQFYVIRGKPTAEELADGWRPAAAAMSEADRVRLMLQR
jgi:hypothetical protein